ncbi:vacuolar sorting protein VPS33/slp1 [Orbilia brochopaga]|uniref:Vacuolar sorting protein VPS33/slp1 n=1 Tax=Orbilia brochopaga TaxID=3140254 RepID=A0AAV9U2V2_9PEZI
MATSSSHHPASDLIKLQKEVILNAIKRTQPLGQWRYVVADTEALALIDQVVHRDEIINQNVAGVEELQSRRTPHSDMEAVYFLTPKNHILECLLSEFKRPKPRYLKGHLVWTSSPSEHIRHRLSRQTQTSGHWIQSERILPINFYPIESNIFTFRDPKSFYPLYNPKCDGLAQYEFVELAKKIVGICVALEEFPVVRYFLSPHLTHRARKLPQMVAMAVQRELEMYQHHMHEMGQVWPPVDTGRPRGTLFIVDRSLDPVAPLLHEFTYQAMAHDLLPIKNDNGKLTYAPASSDGRPMVLNEDDKVWTKVRHMHMTDTINTVMKDLDKFIKDHPEFQSAENANTVFALKTMLAALPQFSAMKDAYELHLTMAKECMDIFGVTKLADVADLEQNLATGLDSQNKKPQGLTEQVVRLLDSPSTEAGNVRLRLIMLYLIWRDGLIPLDIEKLFHHAKITSPLKSALYNLDLIGVRVLKQLKEPNRPGYKYPPPAAKLQPVPDGMELSRYVPAIKTMLEDHMKGTLEFESYPFTDPTAAAEAAAQAGPQASLRTAKPTWTKQRTGGGEPKQRLIVFVAGGATYSEARSCYEVANSSGRDVYLGSSHMVSPNEWLEQLASGREDRILLSLEADQPPPKTPSHLFDPDPEPKRPPVRPQGSGSSGSVPQVASAGGGRPQAASSGKVPQVAPAHNAKPSKSDKRKGR